VDPLRRICFCHRSLLSPVTAITILVGLSSLPWIRSLQAADKATFSEPGSIDIRVRGEGFGASPADIKAILESAAGELWRYCPDTRLPGVDVYHRSDHPQTDLKLTDGGRVRIGMTARDNHWAQYSFQFAHEYCHVLINYNNNRTRAASHARNSNLWLEESLCETASLFTLQGLSRSWAVAPPNPVWRNYAQWFSDYLEKRLHSPEHRLPSGTPFLTWFHANESGLRRDGTNRDCNTIIATQLLPIFEREPHGWGALVFFNPISDQSLAQQFINWRSRCPPKLQRFVGRLAAVFGV
jgi:hypothetical protein